MRIRCAARGNAAAADMPHASRIGELLFFLGAILHDLDNDRRPFPPDENRQQSDDHQEDAGVRKDYRYCEEEPDQYQQASKNPENYHINSLFGAREQRLNIRR